MNLTMDLITINVAVTDFIFIFLMLSLFGYFTKHFDTSRFGQDGRILILDLESGST